MICLVDDAENWRILGKEGLGKELKFCCCCCECWFCCFRWLKMIS